MAEWNENNPCFRCGACCEDMRIPIIDPGLPLENSAGALYEHIINPSIAEPLEQVNSPGVHYQVSKRGIFYLQIVGKCPQLGTDGRCLAYNNRPQACENFEQGGGHCKSLTNGRGYSKNFIPLGDIPTSHQQKPPLRPFQLGRLLGL